MKRARLRNRWLLECCLACLSVAAVGGPVDTNALRSATVDELARQAQCYGSTEEKAQMKMAARLELFRRGPDALRAMMPMSKFDNVVIRGFLQEMSDHLSDEQAAPVLLEFLDHPDPKVRKFAAYLLGWHPAPGSADRLLPLLRDGEAAGAAIRTLGKWKVRSALPLLEPFLKHDKELWRIAAANALRDIGDPAAASYLIGALDDALFTVRETAARALVREALEKISGTGGQKTAGET